MIDMDIVFVILLIAVVFVLAGLALWGAYSAKRERLRVAHELRLADWHLQQLSRAAMRQMLDEARRSQAGSWR